MPYYATEDPSGYFLSFTVPRSGRRRFHVSGSGTSSELANLLPKRGDQWPGYQFLLCRGPELVDQKGPDYAIYDTNYEFVPSGTMELADDPLDWEKQAEMQTMETIIPVDIDLDGRPIVNPAGDPYEPAPRRVTYKRLHLFLYEPFYDQVRSKLFENCDNLLPMILGRWTIEPYHMRLNSYQIVGRQPLNAARVPVVYEFDFFLDDSLGKYPFQHPYLAQGRNGWYTDGDDAYKGRFVTAGTETIPQFRAEVEQPVRLGLNGRPLTGIKEYERIRVGSAYSDSRDTYAPADNQDGRPPVLFTETLSITVTDPNTGLPVTNTATGQTQTNTVGYRQWYRGTRTTDLNLLNL